MKRPIILEVMELFRAYQRAARKGQPIEAFAEANRELILGVLMAQALLMVNGKVTFQ